MTTTVVNIKHVGHYNYDVYIGRPGPWGNPFSFARGVRTGFIVPTREEAIEEYRKWLMLQPERVQQAKRELRGKVLGCWCKPLPCHGDILAAIADSD